MKCSGGSISDQLNRPRIDHARLSSLFPGRRAEFIECGRLQLGVAASGRCTCKVAADEDDMHWP